MTDIFMDALTAAPSKPVAWPVPPMTQNEIVRSWRIGPASPPDPHSPAYVPPPPIAPPKPVQAPPIASNPGARPDYADAIDAMVRALETAGDIVFDGEAQAYRRPHCRRYRFTMGE